MKFIPTFFSPHSIPIKKCSSMLRFQFPLRLPAASFCLACCCSFINFSTPFSRLIPVIPSSPFAYDWAELDDENRIDQRRPKIDPDNPPLGPYFDYDFFRNETIMVGDVAFLKCRVHNIANKTVSWVRHMDINLLTVGTVMYTSDTRFQAMHDADTEEWTLKVGSVTLAQIFSLRRGVKGTRKTHSTAQPVTRLD
jgi:hypothetical protein